jgi:2-dehydro-3-deoxyphosphogluconate aldolase/(4S)-4-hydroxy-2-oxoglutarate aldolase
VKLIAIVRLPSAQGLVRVCQELVDAGLPAVEVTLTTPGALQAIAALEGQVGAGSVRTVDDVRRAQEAGASFLVTPVMKLSVLEVAKVPVVCGALTPTEIDAASEAAAFVKVFPASVMGPRYIREVLAPMPELKLIPTGGITPSLAQEYLAAGAVGVGIGSALVNAETMDNPRLLRERAREFLRAVQ